ncbi:MAG: iron ABC transporter permease [Candidatus Methanomethylophilus sp.]|nr:iron ABC transporter permease [Methanomethylophilus sp.]MDD4222186.1 iron ABC transporter permease [Methanomethylophilus sp.]MDD4668520.1 iron ABC transporter permease [Methanomethylophilus sp.]
MKSGEIIWTNLLPIFFGGTGTDEEYDIYETGGAATAAEEGYAVGARQKRWLLIATVLTLVLSIFLMLWWRNDRFSLFQIFQGFFSFSSSTIIGRYVWNIDMPIIVASLAVGAGLSLAGTVMQCVLKNPLASPYTLGVSGAAAFGAALSIIVFNGGAVFAGTFLSTYCTPICAFAFSMIATGAILLLTKATKISSETMVLAGIAISAIFSAGMTLMQYLADSVQLSEIVSWTFGTVAYANWSWDAVVVLVVLLITVYFMVQRWNMNAMEAGDEVAKGLGVNTDRFLTVSMVLASVLAAFLVAKFGIIAFIGLLGPHMARMLIGNDHRYLVPMSLLLGMLLMVVANAVAMDIVRPMILPVGLLTSLLGGPAFIYLLLRRFRR